MHSYEFCDSLRHTGSCFLNSASHTMYANPERSPRKFIPVLWILPPIRTFLLLVNLSPQWTLIQNILWNQKANCRVHNGPLLVPILSQINPVHITPSHSSNVRFNVFSHLRLGLSGGLFPSGYPTKILYIYIPLLPNACSMSCQFHLPWFDYSNYIWWRVQIIKLLIIQFSPIFYGFIHFRYIYFISTISTIRQLNGKLDTNGETYEFHNCSGLHRKYSYFVYPPSFSLLLT
jgi:hypothetical protein